MKKAIFILFLLVSGCQNIELDPLNSGASEHFDFAEYLDGLQRELEQSNSALKKTIGFVDEVETQSLKAPEWAVEFKPFLNSDINKAAWQGLYTISKTANCETYTTDKAKLKTKLFKVCRSNEKVSSIEIQNATSNFLFETQEHLLLSPIEKTYEISRTQAFIAMDPKEINISGSWK